MNPQKTKKKEENFNHLYKSIRTIDHTHLKK